MRYDVSHGRLRLSRQNTIGVTSLILTTCALALWPLAVSAQALPTPEQIELLIAATREEIRSVDQELLYEKTVEPRGGDKRPQPVSCGKVTVRRTQDLAYHSYDATHYGLDQSGNVLSETREIISRSSNGAWLKTLDQSPQYAAPMGYVESAEPGRGADAGWWTPENAMYHLFDAMRGMFNADFASASQNDVGNYVVVIQTPGREVTYEVDPAKGFVPVHSAVYDTTEGVPVVLSEFKGRRIERVADGIWMPMEHETWVAWDDAGDEMSYVHESWQVERLVVNQPIERELLEVTFPQGVLVRDRLAHLRYVIGEEVHRLSSTINEDSGMIEILDDPPSEAALEAVHVSGDSGPAIPESLVKGRKGYFFGPIQFTALLLGGIVALFLLRSRLRKPRQPKSQPK